MLSKLVSPSIKSIDSIEQLNQYKDSKTTMIFKRSFVYRNNYVSKVI